MPGSIAGSIGPDADLTPDATSGARRSVDLDALLPGREARGPFADLHADGERRLPTPRQLRGVHALDLEDHRRALLGSLDRHRATLGRRKRRGLLVGIGRLRLIAHRLDDAAVGVLQRELLAPHLELPPRAPRCKDA